MKNNGSYSEAAAGCTGSSCVNTKGLSTVKTT